MDVKIPRGKIDGEVSLKDSSPEDIQDYLSYMYNIDVDAENIKVTGTDTVHLENATREFYPLSEETLDSDVDNRQELTIPSEVFSALDKQGQKEYLADGHNVAGGKDNKNKKTKKTAKEESPTPNMDEASKEELESIRQWLNGETDGYTKPKYSIAYHGSPHNFDTFSLEHIGTGEGHQVHGWGLYFAGKEEISKAYWDRETMKREYWVANYDGKQHTFEELKEDVLAPYKDQMPKTINGETNWTVNSQTGRLAGAISRMLRISLYGSKDMEYTMGRLRDAQKNPRRNFEAESARVVEKFILDKGLTTGFTRPEGSFLLLKSRMHRKCLTSINHCLNSQRLLKNLKEVECLAGEARI